MRRKWIVVLTLFAIAAPAAAFAGANQGALLLVSCGSVTKATPATCAALGGRGCYFNMTPNFNTQAAPLQSWIAVYVGRWPDVTALTGVDFGIYYDANSLYSMAWTRCGQLEVYEAGWPASGRGNTVVWTSAQAGETVLVGYFTCLKYTGYGIRTYDFTVGAHPLYGVPRALDAASNFDILRYPSVANLMGEGGHNQDCEGFPVKPTTWGRIKSQY